MNLERCQNCGREIGALETPAIWQDHVVCGACGMRLAEQLEQPAQQQAALPVRVAARPVVAHDPLQELAAMQGNGPLPYAQPTPPAVVYHVGPAYPARPPGIGLRNAGAVLMLIAVPLVCFLWPMSFLLFFTGLVLWIVGMCQS